MFGAVLHAYPWNLDALPHTEFCNTCKRVQGIQNPFECRDCLRQTKVIGLLEAVLHWRPRFKKLFWRHRVTSIFHILNFDSTYHSDFHTSIPNMDLSFKIAQLSQCNGQWSMVMLRHWMIDSERAAPNITLTMTKRFYLYFRSLSAFYLLSSYFSLLTEQEDKQEVRRKLKANPSWIKDAVASYFLSFQDV